MVFANDTCIMDFNWPHERHPFTYRHINYTVWLLIMCVCMCAGVLVS